MTPMLMPDDVDPWAKPPKPPLPCTELKGLQRRRNGPALRYMLEHLAIGAATTALIAWSWGTWWMLPAMFVQGIVIVFLFAPMHECMHGTAFRTRRLNSTVATFCGVSMMRPAPYFLIGTRRTIPSPGTGPRPRPGADAGWSFRISGRGIRHGIPAQGGGHSPRRLYGPFR